MSHDDGLYELEPAPLGWVVAQYAVIALCVLVLGLNYDRIPDPLPVHWGPSGQADSWTDKSAGAVFGMLAISVVPLGVFTPVIVYAAHQQAKFAHRELPKEPAEDVNRARATANEVLPLVAKLMTALTALVMGAVTLSLLGLMKGPWEVTLLVALIIGVVGWFVVAMRAARSHVVELFGHDDFSRNLRWGMFYANPADARVVAEHLMSTTLNFARPGAWALLGAILLPVAVIAIAAVAAGKIL